MSSHENAGTSALATTAGRLRAALAPKALAEALIAGSGGFITIFLLSWLNDRLEVLLLIAPFGASCVLVFALPQSPLAQPRNVIGGHAIATIAGLLVQMSFGATPLGFALGVALAIAGMILTRTVHPPAGADPIVVLLASASWSFLATPVLIGASTIVLAGIVYHRIASGKAYPTT
ncbi:MAG: HPP family protein [Bosea sp.]|jgi:CBS-domain-containing membrane protein|nr:HPP family protein [Bosea sp. (in: a-proteobacteria)]